MNHNVYTQAACATLERTLKRTLMHEQCEQCEITVMGVIPGQQHKVLVSLRQVIPADGAIAALIASNAKNRVPPSINYLTVWLPQAHVKQAARD
jgi:hypothetical protein